MMPRLIACHTSAYVTWGNLAQWSGAGQTHFMLPGTSGCSRQGGIALKVVCSFSFSELVRVQARLR